jgi:DMSO/TMAO reductase YedYZ molybdopterin-dependent catalytic subunit
MVGTRRVGPLIGVLAASVGLAAAELVAGIVPTGRSPVVAVGDAVIRLSPGSVERWAIRTLGTRDKPALVLGVLVVTLLLGAIAGRVPGSVGVAIVGAASVAGAWAALVEEDASWVHALPPLLGGVAAVVTLRMLWRAASDGRDAPLGVSAAGRRRLLLAGTAAGSVAAVAATTGRLLQGRVDASASRRAVVLPRPAEPLPGVGAGADLGVPGVPPFVTPIDDFYRIDVSLVVPQVETDGWTLRVDGLVDRPLSLTYEELLDRPLVEADVTLVCVSNEVGGRLIGNARWLGVPLASLLSEAGVRRDRADQVVGRAVDGFTAGFPLKAALDGRDALVAVGMNGEPLPLRHGFPARLVVGGLYGYVSATKWLSSIEVTRFDAYDPYWIQRGWARMGPVKVSSRIDTPRSTVGAGPVPVGGVAWAQGRGVGRVEVRVDEDGRWHDAELGAAVGDDTWRQWRWTWPARRGRHRLTVRATTLDGEVQTRDISPPFPSGATGWHSVDVRVV